MFIGLDLGTSGLKAVLLDRAQRVRARATASRRPPASHASSPLRSQTAGRQNSVRQCCSV